MPFCFWQNVSSALRKTSRNKNTITMAPAPGTAG
jgi:hypothetical protein